MGSPRVSKNFVAGKSRVNRSAPKGRGAVSICGSAAWARPATTARHWNDGISGHYERSA
jgi:hypothetical protein